MHDHGGVSAGRRPSVWILILLLFALMGVALVHEPENGATAGARAGRPWIPASAASRTSPDHVPVSRPEALPPEAREDAKGEVKKDGGP